MFAKTVLLASLLLVGGARAQCPNGGVGVGLIQFCNIGNPVSGSFCDDTDGFITTPGSFNTAATKVDIGGPTDLCGLGWSGGARTACDGNGNVISVNPPGAGTSNCHAEGITVPGSSNLGVASIFFCCYNP